MTRSQSVRFALVVLLWSFTWYVIRDQVVSGVPAPWSVAYRFLLAGAVIATACVATGRPLVLDRRGLAFAAVVGFFQFTLNFNLVYEAERHVTSGLPSVVFALLVVPNALLAWAFLDQRVDRHVVFGAVFGIAGVALLFRDEILAPGGLGAGGLGLGLTVMAVLAASCANVMQAGGRARALPPWTMLGYSMLMAGLANAVLAWGLTGPPPLDLTPRYVAGLVYLAVGGSAAAFLLYYALIREIGPARAAYSSLAIPFVAMAVSTVFEGYRWTGWAVAGAALAAGGIALALGGARRPA